MSERLAEAFAKIFASLEQKGEAYTVLVGSLKSVAQTPGVAKYLQARAEEFSFDLRTTEDRSTTVAMHLLTVLVTGMLVGREITTLEGHVNHGFG